MEKTRRNYRKIGSAVNEMLRSFLPRGMEISRRRDGKEND
jgi:hypothetical protein